MLSNRIKVSAKRTDNRRHSKALYHANEKIGEEGPASALVRSSSFAILTVTLK